jgi:hypothetical protein
MSAVGPPLPFVGAPPFVDAWRPFVGNCASNKSSTSPSSARTYWVLRRVGQVVVLCVLGALLAVLISFVLAPNREDRGRDSRSAIVTTSEGVPGALVSNTTEPSAPSSRAEGVDPLEPGTEPIDIVEQAAARVVEASVVSTEASPSSARGVTPSAAASGDGDDSPRRASEYSRAWCFWPPVDHEIASDSSDVWNGTRSVMIGSGGSQDPARHVGLDTLWQVVDATPYRGMRVEFAVHVKTNAPGTVSVFLDAWTPEDPPAGAQTRPVALASFPLPQTWARLSVVADIPVNAERIYYGVSYLDTAALWVDDAGLGPAGAGRAVTGTQANTPAFFTINVRSVLPAPENLSFELTTDAPIDEACEAVPVA